MKIVKHIKIRKETVNEILKLDAVEKVEMWHDGRIVVRLLPKYTDGKCEAMKDEHLVQFKNGKWQRYGNEAFLRLANNADE